MVIVLFGSIMDNKIFEELGFTNAETKIYLALLSLGPSTAGPILTKTKLHNSVVHRTLGNLAEKGLVSFIIKGKTKHYQAIDPKKIIKIIESRKKEFEEILPELESMQKPFIRQSAEVYQGFKGLKVMFYELIKDAKKGDEFLFFVFNTKNPEKYEIVYNFYRKEYYEERRSKKLKMMGLAPESLRRVVEKAKWTKEKVKFVDMPIPMNTSICNGKVAFTPWDDGEVSFLINSPQLAESFRDYFYSIWKTTK